MLFVTLILGLVLCGISFAEETFMNGVKKKFYPDGKLKSEITFKDGKKEGVYKYYDQNGHLDIEGIYKNNEKDGLEKRYYESGELVEEWVFGNGKQELPWAPLKRYYKNGQLHSASIVFFGAGNKKIIF